MYIQSCKKSRICSFDMLSFQTRIYHLDVLTITPYSSHVRSSHLTSSTETLDDRPPYYPHPPPAVSNPSHPSPSSDSPSEPKHTAPYNSRHKSTACPNSRHTPCDMWAPLSPRKCYLRQCLRYFQSRPASHSTRCAYNVQTRD
jgi:hypothetical protein